MRLKFAGLILALTLLPSFQTQAATIDYIFTGTGTGDLNGAAFDGNFNFTIQADTGTVVGSGTNFVTNDGTATFSSGALNTTLATARAVINSGDPKFVTIQFAQFQPPVTFVSEAIINPVFAGYNLDTAFPLTSGDLSVQPQTYLTAAGNLDFNTITALSFEAVEPAPLPAALPMMMAALAGLGLFAFARRKTVRSRI